jgi:hypothetical protein
MDTGGYGPVGWPASKYRFDPLLRAGCKLAARESNVLQRCEKETTVISSLLLVSVSLLSQNAPPATPATPPAELVAEVKKLVQQLDDPSQAKRDAAEKALAERGPDILPLLPAITARTPAETKERLGRVRKSLETALSDVSSKATTISLKGEMALADAMKAIEKQTGNKFAGYDRRTSTVKLDLEKASFWPAIDGLLDQAEMDINAYGGEMNTLVLMARAEGASPRSGHAAYSGVFRFEALRVEARRDLRNSSVSGMRLTLGISWEPRITPISMRQPIDKITAVDDQGKSLTVRDEESQQVLNATAETGMSAVELGIPLDLPPRGATKIASLKGSLTALVPGRLESFEFSGIVTARDAEQQRAGVAVILERVRQNGDLYEVRVRVRYDEAGNALESHRGWVYSNPAYIVNTKGERLDSLGSNEGGRDENEIGIVMLFDIPGGPKGCKFVYQTPASMLQLPVEYELKDIELP